MKDDMDDAAALELDPVTAGECVVFGQFVLSAGEKARVQIAMTPVCGYRKSDRAPLVTYPTSQDVFFVEHPRVVIAYVDAEKGTDKEWFNARATQWLQMMQATHAAASRVATLVARHADGRDDERLAAAKARRDAKNAKRSANLHRARGLG